MTVAELTTCPRLFFVVSCPSVFNVCLICVCLFATGCGNGGNVPNACSQPNLTDLLDLVVEQHNEAGEEGAISLRAVLVNKSSHELEVYFDGKEYQSAGGFRVHHGKGVLAPRVRLSGTTEYDVLRSGYGLLPAHGRRGFDLLFELPRDEAHGVLADPQSIRVVLLIHGIRRDSSYSELAGSDAVLAGHWKQSVQRRNESGFRSE